MSKRRRVDGFIPLVGDLIRATWYAPDHTRQVEGRVGAVIYNGTERTFKGTGGHVLYEWSLGSPMNPVIELLDAVPGQQETIEGL